MSPKVVKDIDEPADSAASLLVLLAGYAAKGVLHVLKILQEEGGISLSSALLGIEGGEKGEVVVLSGPQIIELRLDLTGDATDATRAAISHVGDRFSDPEDHRVRTVEVFFFKEELLSLGQLLSLRY